MSRVLSDRGLGGVGEDEGEGERGVGGRRRVRPREVSGMSGWTGWTAGSLIPTRVADGPGVLLVDRHPT